MLLRIQPENFVINKKKGHHFQSVSEISPKLKVKTEKADNVFKV